MSFFLDLWWHPTLAQIPNKPKQPDNHGTGGTIKKKIKFQTVEIYLGGGEWRGEGRKQKFFQL